MRASWKRPITFFVPRASTDAFREPNTGLPPREDAPLSAIWIRWSRSSARRAAYKLGAGRRTSSRSHKAKDGHVVRFLRRTEAGNRELRAERRRLLRELDRCIQ